MLIYRTKKINKIIQNEIVIKTKFTQLMYTIKNIELNNVLNITNTNIFYFNILINKFIINIFSFIY